MKSDIYCFHQFSGGPVRGPADFALGVTLLKVLSSSEFALAVGFARLSGGSDGSVSLRSSQSADIGQPEVD
jgi:hypothetical protein